MTYGAGYEPSHASADFGDEHFARVYLAKTQNMMLRKDWSSTLQQHFFIVVPCYDPGYQGIGVLVELGPR